MRKSLRDIAHMVREVPYPGELSEELKPYHSYLIDRGHVIMCVLEMHLEQARGDMDNYELGVPVSYVLEKGYRFVKGYVVVDAQYNNEIGLDIDDKYYI
jgi:hypothetical protein